MWSWMLLATFSSSCALVYLHVLIYVRLSSHIEFPPDVTFEADYNIEKVDNNYNIMFKISVSAFHAC